jgi:hypothetical protein
MIYLTYLLNLIKKNLGKSITLILTIFSFYYAGKFEDDIITKNIVGQNTVILGIDTTHFYLCTSDNKTIEVVNFSKEKKILPNNIIVYNEYDILNVLMWVLFIVGMTILIIGTFCGDDDLNWDLYDTWVKTLVDDIRIIEESNKYYWVLKSNNKLIDFRDVPTNFGNPYMSIESKIRDYTSHKNLYPEFLSQEDKREKKLNKIGI